LFRVTNLAVQLTLNQLPEAAVLDHAKLKAAFEFLKTVNAFAFQFPPIVTPPRAFSGYLFDKPPYADKLITLRFALLGQYCQLDVFNQCSRIVRDYAVQDGNRYPVLPMMTLIGEILSCIFKCYTSLRAVTRLKERLLANSPDSDLNDNYVKTLEIVREVGKFVHTHLLNLIRTEPSASILSVAQLTVTSNFLRVLATQVGPLDTDKILNVHPIVAAMQMSARLVFEGLATETNRRDILDWSVAWVKRQMELDYGMQHKNVIDSDIAVGQQGIVYLFHFAI
jgi:hypothetical protein